MKFRKNDQNRISGNQLQAETKIFLVQVGSSNPKAPDSSKINQTPRNQINQ